MSRQLYFFHTEDDALRLLQFALSKGAAVFYDEMPMHERLLPRHLHNEMDTFSCRYHLYPNVLLNRARTVPSRYDMIEFMNCTRGDSTSQTHEVGRIYLAPDRDGAYAPETTKLYEALRRYIKANYRYEKRAGVYISPVFLEKSLSHEVSAAWAKRGLTIEPEPDGTPKIVFAPVAPLENSWLYF